jgi:hypothetical protein
VLPIFDSLHKKIRKYKKDKKMYSEENKKKIAVRRGCQSTQNMIKRWLRKFKNKKLI